MRAVISWWLDLLLHHGLIGPLLAIVLAAFVVLAAGNAVIWPLVGVKALIRRLRSRAGLSPRSTA